MVLNFKGEAVIDIVALVFQGIDGIRFAKTASVLTIAWGTMNCGSKEDRDKGEGAEEHGGRRWSRGYNVKCCPEETIRTLAMISLGKIVCVSSTKRRDDCFVSL